MLLSNKYKKKYDMYLSLINVIKNSGKNWSLVNIKKNKAIYFVTNKYILKILSKKKIYIENNQVKYLSQINI